MNIVAISRCLKRIEQLNVYHFHFIGYFNGHYVKMLIVRSERFLDKNDIWVGEDYYLKLVVEHYSQNKLYVNLKSYRELFG
jgi:hypothetical protein